MSSVDERVVKMQFNNAQFERGIKETSNSLEKLKNALRLDKAAEGLDELQKTGDRFSLSNIENSVDNLKDRFSVFGTFASRIIENLADSVYNKLGSALKSITIGDAASGWSKYAKDTKAVQTIMFATGETIENVESELDKLMFFTDETSYSYEGMVDNIGKFTSMKIPLSDARIAMQGIALAAAAAGQGATEANRAMYNISQAMGVGQMKLMDWRSIENANMATADLKQNAINAAIALGTLGEGGVTLDGKEIVTIENFSDTLQKGWFTKDVIMEVFGEYGEFAEKVQQLVSETGMDTSDAIAQLSGTTSLFSENAFRAGQEAKTFEEALDALHDAASTKWLKIFKLIFGNYENAKVLWTKLANDLYEIFVDPLDAIIGSVDEETGRMEGLLKPWNALEEGMGGWKDFMQGVYDIMDGLKGLLLTVRDAFSNLLPPITLEKLQSFTLAFRDFGASFKAAFGIPEEESEEAASEIEKVGDSIEEATEQTKSYNKELKETSVLLGNSFKFGDKGEEVKAFQEQLSALGYDVGSVDGIYGSKTEEAYKRYIADATKAKEATDELVESSSDLSQFARKRPPQFQVTDEIEDVGDAAKTTTESIIELEEALQRGSKGDDVKKMQEMLIALGYDLDKYGADGIFGPETQAALKEYERDAGLAIDGVYDAAEAQSLTEAFELGEVKKGFEELGEPLKLGDKSEEVKTLQKRLQELGYDVGPLDGIYGPKTQKALEQFEKDAGNAVDGIYDETDHAAMREKMGFSTITEDAKETSEAINDISSNTSDAEKSTDKYSSKLEAVQSIFGGIAAAGGIVLKIFNLIGDVVGYVLELASPLIDSVLTISSVFGNALIDLNNYISESGLFSDWFKEIKKYIAPLGGVKIFLIRLLNYLELKTK